MMTLKALSSSAQRTSTDSLPETRNWTAADPAPRPARIEGLFAELDGRDIWCEAAHWLTSVSGIHTFRDEAWIQMSLLGRFSCSVIVHLLPTASAREAIAALSAWLDSRPGDRPQIIEASTPVISVVQAFGDFLLDTSDSGRLLH